MDILWIIILSLYAKILCFIIMYVDFLGDYKAIIFWPLKTILFVLLSHKCKYQYTYCLIKVYMYYVIFFLNCLVWFYVTFCYLIMYNILLGDRIITRFWNVDSHMFICIFFMHLGAVVLKMSTPIALSIDWKSFV